MDGPLRPPTETAPERPERIGPWLLEDEIGSGGGSVVYAASRSTPTGPIRAALKLARRLSAHSQSLFDAEAQILRRVSPPAVAGLLDAGHHRDGRPYLALEVVEGMPVTEHARPLSLRDRLALASRACHAVAALHDAGIVHADLKPDHLVVRERGAVTVLDLGLARAPGLGSGLGLEADRPAITPEFAAPEQVLGHPVGFHTDVYALGLIVSEVLTGRPARVPWVLGGTENVLDLPASLAEGASSAPWASVDWRVVTALRASVHADPERRFRTAGDLARALHDATDGA